MSQQLSTAVPSSQGEYFCQVKNKTTYLYTKATDFFCLLQQCQFLQITKCLSIQVFFFFWILILSIYCTFIPCLICIIFHKFWNLPLFFPTMQLVKISNLFPILNQISWSRTVATGQPSQPMGWPGCWSEPSFALVFYKNLGN